MPRFFVENGSILSDTIVIGGEDAKHISLSLRARVGEKITACYFVTPEDLEEIK